MKEHQTQKHSIGTGSTPLWESATRPKRDPSAAGQSLLSACSLFSLAARYTVHICRRTL